MNLNELRDQAERIGREHGFTDASIGDDIALMHSELSEALEDHRKGRSPMEVWYEEKVSVFDKDGKPIMVDGKPAFIGIRHDQYAPGLKPCGIPSELADEVIRILHFSGKHGIDIEKAVTEKMAYNETRPFKHGNKVL